MNALSTRNRKLVYMGIVLALLVPIIYLGQPPTTGASASGGLISRMRFEEDLGEASLGDVDPASTSMSLVLLGLRGIAANILWMQAEEEKMTKQWSQLERTVESILLLQPHFQSVWKFQCWNLTYNVSAECDAVEDRYFWVKRGLIFLTRGVDRNRYIPELPHDAGDFSGKKIGRADEREFYRKFFVVDPDRERFNGGPDKAVNPDGIDNYLRAREWYQLANDRADLGKVQQHKMDFPLFFAYPYRSLFDYATAQQQDAVNAPLEDIPSLFQDAQQRWAEAAREWTSIYGRKVFTVPIFGTLQIDGTEEELAQFAAADNMSLEQKLVFRDRYQNTVGYRFWKTRCEVEAETEMSDAHRLLVEGRRKYERDQDMVGAEEAYREGLLKMQSMFQKFAGEFGPNQLGIDDRDLAEEVIKALIFYRSTRELLGNPVDENEDYPMRQLWIDPEMQSQIKELLEKFQRWQGGLTT
ncbi:MAG: hypothetical protein KF774_14600 [Planctomyces sp.]|nr:hypothetical protein [Planctomyces sp.]